MQWTYACLQAKHMSESVFILEPWETFFFFLGDFLLPKRWTIPMIFCLIAALQRVQRGQDNRFTGTLHQSPLVSVGLLVLWSARAKRQGWKKLKMPLCSPENQSGKTLLLNETKKQPLLSRVQQVKRCPQSGWANIKWQWRPFTQKRRYLSICCHFSQSILEK